MYLGDWKPAPNPVRLITANNTVLKGGDKFVELGLNFSVVEDGFLQPQPISFKGDFYGAEIELDAILSYPWLRENSVGVFLHRDALARDWPYFGLLYAWKEKYSAKSYKELEKRSRRRDVRPVLAVRPRGEPPL